VIVGPQMHGWRASYFCMKPDMAQFPQVTIEESEIALPFLILNDRAPMFSLLMNHDMLLLYYAQIFTFISTQMGFQFFISFFNGKWKML